MARQYKYMNEADRHNYLVDKVDVLFTQFFLIEMLDSHPIDEVFPLHCPGLEIRAVPARNQDGESGFRLQCYLSFNFNRALRYYFQEKYEIKSFESSQSDKDNVLPSKLRILLKKDGISNTQVRDIGYQLFFDEINKARKKIADRLRSPFKLSKWQYEAILQMHFTFYHIEINYDLSTPPGINLSNNKCVRENFSKVAKSRSYSIFKNKFGEKLLPENVPNEISSVNDEDDDKDGYHIHGYYHDRSKFKLYLKETSPEASINRFERIFIKRQLMKLLNRKRSAPTVKELDNVISTLGHHTFEGVIDVFKTECEYSDKQLRKIVKRYCREFYKHDAELAFEKLVISPNTIYTGRKGGASDRRLIARTLKLSNEEKFVRPKSGQRGYYCLDWDWIKQKRF